MRNMKELNLSRYDDDVLLKQDFVAEEILGVQVPTLNSYRFQGKFDCPFYRVNGQVFYRVADLKEWFMRNRVDPAQRRKENKEKAAEVA